MLNLRIVKGPDQTLEKPNDKNAMWLNKYIAHCGVCSRRKAVDHIKAGEVTVNGVKVISPAYNVQEGDVVIMDGKKLVVEEKKVYILLNKPKNTVTTTSDELGRPTVMELVKKNTPERIFPVGRLDRNTTGLLLLTNDGDLAKKLSHPSHKVKKIYQVTLDKPLERAHFDSIKKGFTLEDGDVAVDGLEYYSGKEANEVAIEIHIGRNRIVRRIFEHFGYHVDKLDRMYYAGLTKKDLKRGWSRHLTEQEIIMLKHFI
ncbi:MAG: rRNA pseudouridine synthase [Saprospiraceae bacterium]|nr:rRNA pseudouridine synthase [Saprospiraceae bacterium]